ncbi:hypothetical protein WMY93_001060 [Mugilogobius chulae]|uniref:C2H2-type domain-containing protein n=1 Tax=Mugilogobius chulae TaxID=88201 RepID=A0AAW0Q499_9GOBI
MAAEMSCLTGVDAEDKDADPEINALMLMQEPLRMTSCTDAFSKSLGQPNSVLDVLSSEDMLSPVGLGNGPSVHQPTEAHELNNFSNEKEEEKNITPLKTVQEIGGIWDFDIDSPDDSSDNFNSPSNIPWDSQKEIMQFLWDSHEDSPGEEPKDEAPPPDIPKRRKRKMDMVVMVDPSEELFPPEDQEDEIPLIRVRKSRMSPSRTSPSRTVTKYTNGTAKPIKHILYNSPTRQTIQKRETNGNANEKDPYELPESPLSENDQVQSESELDPSYCPRTRIVTIIQNKTYSKRKVVVTPIQNSSEEDSVLPNSSSTKGMEEDEDDFAKRDLSPFRDIDNNHVDSIFKRQKQIIYTYSRRMSMRGALQASKKLYEKIKSEEQDQSDVEIKDEDTDEDLVIENESVQTQNSMDELQTTDSSRKNCPYCSAYFESGVGLSNHVRGHLHRVGVNHKSRHKVSAENIATTEEKPPLGKYQH